ncbi:MAG TPA: pantoate--beta-alanine ligase [Smithella sp.]|nr:pantoate--beta-alanine ligase [Smithella sp.]
MRIIKSVKQMQSFSTSLKGEGDKIAFVPTMGYFHEGHLFLMKEAKKMADCVVVSIYVNPTQFGPKEDFSKYPRDFDRDLKLAEKVNVDVIFYPADKEMYPANYQTYVDVEKVTQNLCGMSRPGHFRGVTTVCNKLFNIVKPDIAVFGKKDFQQFVTIKRMVDDLNMDLQIIGLPTVRESDGLAMSSRNKYLQKDERKSALALFRALKLAQKLYSNGETKSSVVISNVEKIIKRAPYTAIDYIKICDTRTLKDTDKIKGQSVIALAVKVGKTRLIDNHVFGEKLDG